MTRSALRNTLWVKHTASVLLSALLSCCGTSRTIEPNSTCAAIGDGTRIPAAMYAEQRGVLMSRAVSGGLLPAADIYTASRNSDFVRDLARSSQQVRQRDRTAPYRVLALSA